MMKTRKFLSAAKILSSMGMAISGCKQDEIYELLQEKNYLWNVKTQSWEQHANKPSVFDDANEGFVRIRIMASPERIDEATKLVTGYCPEVLEVSEPYHNSKNRGVSVYLLVKLGN